MRLDATAFCALFDDPAGLEALSAVGGEPLVVVTVEDMRDVSRLSQVVDAATIVPAVLVAIVATPVLGEFESVADVFDVVLGDVPSDEVVVAPADGVEAAVADLYHVIGANPLAAAALVLLLRRVPPGRIGTRSDQAVAHGLVAESAVYSALQGGAEFARWRVTRPIRAADEVDRGRPRVQLERRGPTFTITLDRPARRNAVDRHMRDALTDALRTAELDIGLRVVLRGNGPDFSAGGDLDEFGSRPDPATAHVVRLTRSVAWAAHRVAGRTEVYLHGSCLGAGIEVPAFARRIVAAPGTSMGIPEVALGLVPGSGGTVSLPGRIGRHRTAYLALTDRRIGVDVALDWGLIDEVLAD